MHAAGLTAVQQQQLSWSSNTVLFKGAQLYLSSLMQKLLNKRPKITMQFPDKDLTHPFLSGRIENILLLVHCTTMSQINILGDYEGTNYLLIAVENILYFLINFSKNKQPDWLWLNVLHPNVPESQRPRECDHSDGGCGLSKGLVSMLIGVRRVCWSDE